MSYSVLGPCHAWRRKRKTEKRNREKKKGKENEKRNENEVSKRANEKWMGGKEILRGARR